MVIHVIWFKECLHIISKGYGLSFGKLYLCQILHYIIIIFSLTPRDHMHHLQKLFDQLKELTLSCILTNVDSSKFKWTT